LADYSAFVHQAIQGDKVPTDVTIEMWSR
jgi:hypothetical protein